MLPNRTSPLRMGASLQMATLFLLASLLFCCTGLSHAQGLDARAARPSVDTNQRLALVIGNATYAQSPLINPVNDARAMAQALRESGFFVISRENVDQRGMLAALREFGDRLRAGGTGLFYFSGHGMQIKGRNYLVPVDAAFEREDEIAYKTVDAQAVLDKMEAAGNAANIMILDACRTNPFARGSRAGQQGLAQMDAPVGTLVAYATSPGSVASDGLGVNGLYTHHLLNAIRQSGSKVEDVFKQVRTNVRRDSAGAQVPWEATSLEGDFYFRSSTGAPLQATAAAIAHSDPLEVALWDAVKTSTVHVQLQSYLNLYPSGKFAAQARARLADLQAAAGNLGAVSAPAQNAQGSPSVLTNAAVANLDASSAGTRFVVGDRWRFQVVDKFKSEVVRNYTDTVERVLPDGNLVLNAGRVRWDSKGNVQSVEAADSDETYSNYIFIPPVLQSGARTPLRYTIMRKTAGNSRGATDEAKGSMVVRGREKVVTPAGEFDAWRVEIDVYGSTRTGSTDSIFGAVSSNGPWRRLVTGWYVPELRNYVAYEEQTRGSNGIQNSSTGGYSTRERHELTSFSVRGADGLSAAR